MHELPNYFWFTTAVNLRDELPNFKCSGTKNVMFDTKLGHVLFFVTYPRLDATDGNNNAELCDPRLGTNEIRSLPELRHC